MASVQLLVVFLLGLLASALGAVRVVPTKAQVSVPWDTRFQATPAPEVNLPLSSKSLVRKGQALAPEQIHLTYWTPTASLVSWAAGSSQMGLGLTPPTGAGITPTLRWGTEAGQYTSNVTGRLLTYQAIYEGIGPAPSINYVSPFLSHAIMTDLEPGATYHYQVGFPEQGAWSQDFTMTQPKSSFPFKVLVMSDSAQTENTTWLLKRVQSRTYDLMIYPGDYSYADYYYTNGSQAGYLTGVPAPFQYSSYQPRWDSWGRLFEPLMSKTPYLGVGGNHELENDAAGVTFMAMNARYPFPTKGTTSVDDIDFTPITYPNANATTNMYYSVDVPGVAHFVFLQSYIPGDVFNASNPQLAWLQEDLAKVNRSATPWVIASWHFPIYSTDNGNFGGNECFRQMIEPTLYEYGVDVVLNSHVHGYERTYPMYNYTRDDCGIVHITVGNGGAPMNYPQYLPSPPYWIDEVIAANNTPYYCKDPYSRRFNPQQPQRCFPHFTNTTMTQEGGGYCYWGPKQAAWSAYRYYAFGLAELEILNATHAKWSSNRIQDKPTKNLDEVMFIRNTKCANRRRSHSRRHRARSL